MPVVDVSRVPEFLKALRELESMYVQVGILSSADGEMIMIANVHEFGIDIDVTPKMKGYFRHNFGVNLKVSTIRIPERSFVRSSFDAKKDEVGKTGDELIKMVLDGKLSATQFYDMLGKTCADTIRAYLVKEVNAPPNAPFTVQRKGSSNPLVDTGRLGASIDYEIMGG